MLIHHVKSSLLWFTSYFNCLLNDHHLSFKVPETPKRRVPEERKPVPVPKTEAPSAKGISTALVKKRKKQNPNKYSFFVLFFMFSRIYLGIYYVPLVLHYLCMHYLILSCLHCTISVFQLCCNLAYSFNLSQLLLLFLNNLVLIISICVAFAGKCRVFLLQESPMTGASAAILTGVLYCIIVSFPYSPHLSKRLYVVLCWLQCSAPCPGPVFVV